MPKGNLPVCLFEEWRWWVTWCNCRVLNVRGVTAHLCGNTKRQEPKQGEGQKKSRITCMKCSY